MMNVAIRCASTSVAQGSSGGFWTWLTGARSNEIPPPDFTLPGVTIPPPLPDHVEAGKTRVTTLPNGVEIASETSATYMPEMVEVLIDCVRNPAFLDWEVKEQILRLKAEIAKSSSNPEKFLLEALHSTGYSGALANPLIASEYAISKLNADVLEQFIIENYTAPRIVLAASGVDHDELIYVLLS
ncbi:unnamed protein product [Miscanthus lutarioriparius]|uniref:Peptidase M16 N-terminal domain-containing protein n=1 Tax=Miscanthus lutarioriparius TaxID=422564 RepID=A0A811NC42_9POAL|nr:unnamed protein product [Miscanthus lutarioriparius]